MVDSTIGKATKSSVNAPLVIQKKKLDTFSAWYYGNALTLMKLREKKVAEVSKLQNGVFRCILEYLTQVYTKRVTERYNENPFFPINYTWPEQVSYENPIRAGKQTGYMSWNFVFMLESGE